MCTKQTKVHYLRLFVRQTKVHICIYASIYELNKLKYISEYTPSQNYKEMSALIDEYLKLGKERMKLELKSNTLYDKIRSIKVSLGIQTCGVNKDLLEEVMNLEYQGKDIPSIESIKEDIIISNINDSFDVERFIKEKLSEYSSYNS